MKDHWQDDRWPVRSTPKLFTPVYKLHKFTFIVHGSTKKVHVGLSSYCFKYVGNHTFFYMFNYYSFTTFYTWQYDATYLVRAIESLVFASFIYLFTWILVIYFYLNYLPKLYWMNVNCEIVTVLNSPRNPRHTYFGKHHPNTYRFSKISKKKFFVVLKFWMFFFRWIRITVAVC